MIVVIGSPLVQTVDGRSVADGVASVIGKAAAAEGAPVQLVGRVGDDAQGDAVLQDLTHSGVGHVAVLRDPARATPSAPKHADDLARIDPLGDDEASGQADDAGPISFGLALDAADVELGLRYLVDFRVLVVADPVDEATLAVAEIAAAASEAQLIALLGRADDPAPSTDGATVFVAPADVQAFGRFVGMFAAGIDLGRSADEAFSRARASTGWEPVGG